MLYFPTEVEILSTELKDKTTEVEHCNVAFAMNLAVPVFLLSVTVVLLCYDAQVVCAGTSRFDRVWPLSGSDAVDFGQASPFGPTVLISQNFSR